MSYEQFPLKIAEMRKPEKVTWSNDAIPSYRELLISERCGKGLAISTMTGADREKILELYNALYVEEFNK